MIAVGTAAISVVFGLTLRSTRGLSAGALAGVAVGFLGLPILASLIGVGGYFVLEWIASKLTDGSTETATRTE